jgi:lipopolysaccharide biosynthesis glycosyltransferase
MGPLFKKGPKHALVTVTTMPFLPGSLVTIHSFLKHNPWFTGDIIVLADQMGPRYQRYFTLFPNARVEQISKEVIQRTDLVSQRFEQFQHRKAQFYSLDLARFTRYEKLLFLDSDILVMGDLSEPFQMDAGLLACPDGFFYNDRLRHPETYDEVLPEDRQPGQEVWTNAFNAGFMLFDGSVLRKKHHRKLVRMINENLFGSVSTNHSDQLIFNQYFRKDYQQLSGAYNYRMGVADKLLEKEGIRFEDARLIHFVKRRKPWVFDDVMRNKPKFPDYLPAYRNWLDNWTEYLERLENRNDKAGRSNE